MKAIKGTIILAGIMTVAAFAAPAMAASDAAAGMQSFGVVDMNKVMQTTDAAKDIFRQMEDKRKEYQKQIAKEEDTLRAAEKDILKQKDALSKDDFEKKRNSFEERVMKGQQMVQDRKHTLDVAFNSSMLDLRKKAGKIVEDIARERHYSAIFAQEAMIIPTPDIDITDVVVERLNKSVKKIPVDWASSAGGKK